MIFRTSNFFQAAVIVSRMIAHMPSTYCHTLAARAQVGVFTKAESMAVYPDYAYMADRPECRGKPRAV